MRKIPFRPLFFLSALLALGVYAAAVTIPHLFTSGEPIVAEEMNENFEALANAASPELIAGPGTGVSNLEKQALFSVVSESVTSTVPGRWLIRKSVRLYAHCGDPLSAVTYYIAIDGVPVTSSSTFGLQGEHIDSLTGITENVIPAGTHTVDVYADCPGGTATLGPAYFRYVSSVVVFPE